LRPYLDLLRRERDFRRTYLAQLVALGGDWFAIIPLLVLLPELTGTGLWGAGVLAVDTLVFALAGPYAGTVVDRLDRRRVIVVANTVAGLAALLLVLVRTEATAWIALVAIGIVAGAKAFAQPAGAAAVPNLVDPDDLATATVLSGASWGTMLAVGAALGGLVAGTLGSTVCFVLDAVLLLGAAALTASTTRPFSDPTAAVRPRRAVREDVGEALGYAWRDHRVLALLTCKSGPAFGNGALALFPLYGAAAFGLGPLGIGLMYSARGVGAQVGPQRVRPRLPRSRRHRRLLAGARAAGRRARRRRRQLDCLDVRTAEHRAGRPARARLQRRLHPRDARHRRQPGRVRPAVRPRAGPRPARRSRRRRPALRRRVVVRGTPARRTVAAAL
jgi:MFS family permease